jgi:hypothetical protein
MPAIDGLAVIECADLGRALRVLQIIGDVVRDPLADLHVVR